MNIGKLFGNALAALIKPFGILSLGLLLLSILIWFVGPLLTIGDAKPLASDSIRLLIILFLSLVWGITGVVLRVRRQAEDQKLLAAARREQDEHKSAAQRAEDTANTQFLLFAKNARSVLRLLGEKRRLFLFSDKRRRFRRYLVIGSEASGKTALLHGAGLSIHRDTLSDADREPAQFVVAEQGLFMEFAAPYLRQREAHEQLVWQRVLEFIRRQRPCQPVDGILLAVSIAHLSALAEGEIEAEGRLLRRRLDEVNQYFRARPPVYVILTHLDQLRGFEEYFATLTTEERNSAFGLPLGHLDESGTVSEQLSVLFSDLVNRLKERQLRYLQAEADDKLRLRAFEFLGQFALLETRLCTLIDRLAQPSHFTATPILRGLFFTSAVQGEPSHDQLSSLLAAHFALQPDSSPASGDGTVTRHTRSFFISGLFQHAVLAESAVGGHTKKTRALERLRAGSLGLAATLVVLAFVVFWWRGYSAGRAYTAELADNVKTASTRLTHVDGKSGNAPAPAAVADALASLAKLAHDTPSHWTFGLYSTVQPRIAGRNAYRRGLDALLLPHTIQYIQKHLQAPQLDAVTRFELLKLYLILGGAAPSAASIQKHMTLGLVARMFPDQSAVNAHRLSRHLTALATLDLPHQTSDKSLVDHARSLLGETGMAQIAYNELKTEADMESRPDWRVIDHIGAAGPQVLTRISHARLREGIKALYTRKGYQAIVLPESKRIAKQIAANLWVMGEKPSAASIQRQSESIRKGILDLYTADTIRHWDYLLADLTFTATDDAKQAARLLALITNKPSPVNQLLTAITKATNFESVVTPLVKLSADPTGISTDTQSAADDAARNITEHYASLRAAVGTNPKAGDKKAKQTQLESTLAALQPLYQELNQLAGNGDPLKLDSKLQATLNGLDQTIENLPDSLHPLFKRLIMQMGAVTGASLRGRLAKSWNTIVLPKCQALVKNHYPFAPKSKADASLADFTTVFGPKGLIASYRKHALEPYIDTSAKPWRWRADKTGGPDLSTEALTALERANEITKTYFDSAGKPKVQFQVKPLGIEGSANAFQLDTGSSTYTYAYGPATATTITWPPSDDDAKVGLSVTPETAGERNAIVYKGAWALFRLLDAGHERRTDAGTRGTAELRFSLGNRSVRLKINAETAHDFVGNPLLSGFTCPELKTEVIAGS